MRTLAQIAFLAGVLSGSWAQEESRHRESVPLPVKPALAQPRPTPTPKEEVVMEMLSGTLLDKDEKVLSNARLWLVDKATGKVLAETRTDAKGNYTIAVPRADTVILRVSVDGKAFMEKEYAFDALLSATEIIFEP
jgi:hypothetical protein